MYYLLKHCELLHELNEKYFIAPTLLQERADSQTLDTLCPLCLDEDINTRKPIIRCFPLKQMSYIHFSSIICLVHEHISKLPQTFCDGIICISHVFKDCLLVDYYLNDIVVASAKISFHYSLSSVLLISRESTKNCTLFCMMAQLIDNILKSSFFTRGDPSLFVSYFQFFNFT